MSSPPQFLRAIWKNDHFMKQAPPLSPCRLFTYLFFNRYSPEKDDISRWLRGPEGQQMRAALWSRSCECAQAVPEAQLLPLAVPKKRIWDPVFRSLGTWDHQDPGSIQPKSRRLQPQCWAFRAPPAPQHQHRTCLVPPGAVAMPVLCIKQNRALLCPQHIIQVHILTFPPVLLSLKTKWSCP